jgi:aldose 1-epimerase
LNGQGRGTILDHQLYINADAFTPMDAASITTGEIMPVSGTPFDFRKQNRIGARIDADDPQLKNGNGYDHNFVLNKTGANLDLAATAIGDKTGIVMDVFTTEPGMQLYTGNFMDGSNTLKGGAPDSRRTAFCLETQHFPDAPHHPHFPSIVLHPDETFQSETVFRFSVAG